MKKSGLEKSQVNEREINCSHLKISVIQVFIVRAIGIGLQNFLLQS
jgi:hypothetical protein